MKIVYIIHLIAAASGAYALLARANPEILVAFSLVGGWACATIYARMYWREQKWRKSFP